MPWVGQNGSMAKALAVKPDILSSIPETHMIQLEN